MRAILILFMVTDTAREGLGLTNETAGAVYGLYTAGVYLLTLPGGWLADNVFGQRKSIWYGGILIMIGHLILAIPGSPEVFFIGLAFVALDRRERAPKPAAGPSHEHRRHSRRTEPALGRQCGHRDPPGRRPHQV